MPTLLRRLQWVGLAFVVVSAALPLIGWQIGTPGLPQALQPGSSRIVLVGPPNAVRTPGPEILSAVGEWFDGSPASESLWSRRPIYAYALLPIWIVLLLLARRRPRTAGVLGWASIVAVIVLEAAYLKSDYQPFFPAILGNLETGIAWCVVVAMLVWRRAPYRNLGAVEATIAAQALLSFVHGLTLPGMVVRDWYEGELSPVVRSVLEEFQAGYWIGMVGFLLIAVTGYVGRRRDGGTTSADPGPAPELRDRA